MKLLLSLVFCVQLSVSPMITPLLLIDMIILYSILMIPCIVLVVVLTDSLATLCGAVLILRVILLMVVVVIVHLDGRYMCTPFPIGRGLVHCVRFNRDLIWVDCPIARYKDIWQGINWRNYRRLRWRQINSCKQNKTVTQLKIQLP